LVLHTGDFDNQVDGFFAVLNPHQEAGLIVLSLAVDGVGVGKRRFSFLA
jgi:hypothetical protein